LRDLRPFFVWAWERHESAGASLERRLNGYAAPIRTGSETHPPATTNWRLNSAKKLVALPNGNPI
jgi:hypothetical protein